MIYKTDDVRIRRIKELLPPIALLERFPITETTSKVVYQCREAIHRILQGENNRLLVIVGPCLPMLPATLE